MRPDPIQGSIGNPQSLNRHTYTDNEPINFSDPLGLDKKNEGKCFIVVDGKVVEVPCGKDDSPLDPDEPPIVLIGWDYFLTVNPWTDSPFLDFQPSVPGRELEIGGGGGNNDARAISGMFNICGTAASYGQYSNVSGGMWKGANGNWYRMGWGGNGATGARSLAQGSAGAFRVLGRSMFVVGAGLSFYQGSQAYRQGNYGAAAKSGLDIAMGGVGLMGPVGATASALYFAVDTTVGWDELLRTARKTAPAHCTTSFMPPVLFLR